MAKTYYRSQRAARPFADVLDESIVGASLVEQMSGLFREDYDLKFTGTLKQSLVSGAKIRARFNSRGTEFLGVSQGSLIINGQLVNEGASVRIDPGEIAEITANENVEFISHIFPYRAALTHKPVRLHGLTVTQVNNPLVSIVIIAKDVEHYICQAISSCTEQTYVNLQIVVVDDGSRDCTASKCHNMAYFDSRVEVHVKPLGRNGVRRYGVEQVRGEYCLIVDGDDWLNRDAIEKLVHAALTGSSDCVTFGFDHVSDKTSMVWNPVYPSDVPLKCPPLYYDHNDISAFWVSHLNHTIWMYFFSTRLKNDVLDSLLVADLYEDLPFFMSLLKSAHRPLMWNEILYHYRRDRVGQSTGNWEKISPAQKQGSFQVAVDHCLTSIGHGKFLNIVLIYKIRRIIDHETNVCIENGDDVAVTAWNSLWKNYCRRFPASIKSAIVDTRTRNLFSAALK